MLRTRGEGVNHIFLISINHKKKRNLLKPIICILEVSGTLLIVTRKGIFIKYVHLLIQFNRLVLIPVKHLLMTHFILISVEIN